MIKLFWGILLITNFFIVAFSQQLFNNEILHPASTFSKIENLCKDLLNDLEVLTSNEQLRVEWVQHSDYLMNQWLALYTSISFLIDNTDESRIYLSNDIAYLIDILYHLEKKYEILCQHDSACEAVATINSILMRCKSKLQQLLLRNQEIIYS